MSSQDTDVFWVLMQKVWTSLVVQWLRIHLQVQSLVWKILHVFGPLSTGSKALELQLLKPAHPRASAPQQKKPAQWEARAPQRTATRESPYIAAKIQRS